MWLWAVLWLDHTKAGKIQIYLILVYWDPRNSLRDNQVIPFKDGVTSVVTTAIQSLQWCNLKSVADMCFATVNISHLWRKFSRFWFENAYISGPQVQVGHRGLKRRSKTQYYYTQNYKNHNELNKVYTLICCTDWILILYQPCDDLEKNENCRCLKMPSCPILKSLK